MTPEEILLSIDPVVPALSMNYAEDWSIMRPLSRDVKEFGWEGTKKLPSVRKMLAKAQAIADATKLRTRLAALEGKWQPIETAPKDGTAILAFFPGRRGYVARQDVATIHWVEWGGGCWNNTSSGHSIMVDEPTHWMPLPEPPSADALKAELEKSE